MPPDTEIRERNHPTRRAHRLVFAAGLLLTAAWTSPAPDVVLYSTPALAAPLRDLADSFTSRGHATVHIFVASPDGLAGLLAHRARADLVVADQATFARLAAAKLIRPETIVALGSDPFVLVASDRAVLPPGADAAQLTATRPTVLPDPTTAASFDGRAVLKTSVPAKPATIGVADTPAVIAAIRNNPALLGLVNRSEARAPGIAIAAPLAAPPAAMQAALVAAGQSAQAASLLAFIAAPDGARVLHAGGLQ